MGLYKDPRGHFTAIQLTSEPISCTTVFLHHHRILATLKSAATQPLALSDQLSRQQSGSTQPGHTRLGLIPSGQPNHMIVSTYGKLL